MRPLMTPSGRPICNVWGRLITAPSVFLRRTSQISTGAPMKAATMETRSSPAASKRPTTSAHSSKIGASSME